MKDVPLDSTLTNVYLDLVVVAHYRDASEVPEFTPKDIYMFDGRGYEAVERHIEQASDSVRVRSVYKAWAIHAPSPSIFADLHLGGRRG